MRPQELLALILSGLLGVGVLFAILFRPHAEKVPVPVPLLPAPDPKRPAPPDERRRRPLFPRPRTAPIGETP